MELGLLNMNLGWDYLRAAAPAADPGQKKR